MYEWHAQRPWSWQQEVSNIEGDWEIKGDDLGEGSSRTSLSLLRRSSSHKRALRKCELAPGFAGVGWGNEWRGPGKGPNSGKGDGCPGAVRWAPKILVGSVNWAAFGHENVFWNDSFPSLDTGPSYPDLESTFQSSDNVCNPLKPESGDDLVYLRIFFLRPELWHTAAVSLSYRGPSHTYPYPSTSYFSKHVAIEIGKSLSGAGTHCSLTSEWLLWRSRAA